MRIIHPIPADTQLCLTTQQVWEDVLAYLIGTEEPVRAMPLCPDLCSFGREALVSAAQQLQEGRGAEVAQIASDVAVNAEKARAWDAACCARLLQVRANHLCQEEPLMWVSYLTALVAASHGRIAQPSWIRLTFFLMAQEMADTGNVEAAVSHYQRAINTALKNKRWAEAWYVVRQLVACQERSDLWNAAQSNLSYYIQVFLLEHVTDALA